MTEKPSISIEQSSIQPTAKAVEEATSGLNRRGFFKVLFGGGLTLTGIPRVVESFAAPPAQAPKEAPATTEASAAKEVIPPGVVSSYPAGFNDMAEVVNGVDLVTPNSFQADFLSKPWAFIENPEYRERDIMFAQLTQPVGELKDRGLNFHKRKGPQGRDQGLGFTQRSFSILKTEGNLTGMLLQEEGEYRRGWALVPARKVESTIETYVDAALKSIGKDPTVVQDERSALISRIMGDLGIKPVEKDGIKQPIGDYFATNVTYLNEAAVGEQKEVVSRVEFAPDVEVAGDDVRQETFARQDSRNTMLFTMVIGKDGYVRVEAFDLGNPQPDSLESTWATHNFQHKDAVEEGKTRRAHGGRLVPVGEVPEEAAEEKKPEETPPPSQTPTTEPTPPPESTPTPGQSPTPEPTPKKPHKEKPVGNPGNVKPVGHAGEGPPKDTRFEKFDAPQVGGTGARGASEHAGGHGGGGGGKGGGKGKP